MVIRQPFLLLVFVASADAQTAPPARDFGREIWASVRGLISSDNAVPAVYGLTAAGSSSLLDHGVREYFGKEELVPAIGSIGNVLGNSLTLGAASGIMFYTSYRRGNERFKAMSFDLTQAVALDAAVTWGVKLAARRERPDQSNSYSFYSGHASSTTAVATVIAHYYPKAAVPAYLFAALAGFSRIEKNRHWLSDVVAGHAVGFIMGRTIVRRRSPWKLGRLEWAPSLAPGGGFMISAQVNLGRLPVPIPCPETLNLDGAHYMNLKGEGPRARVRTE